MNTMPPWSRFVSTQPQSVTSWPMSGARNWPQVWVRSKGRVSGRKVFSGRRLRRLLRRASRAKGTIVSDPAKAGRFDTTVPQARVQGQLGLAARRRMQAHLRFMVLRGFAPPAYL